MVLEASIGVAGFLVGWIARGLLRRHSFARARRTWQREIDTVQGQLALERFHVDQLERLLNGDEPVEAAPMLDLKLERATNERPVARPRRGPADSAASRA